MRRVRIDLECDIDGNTVSLKAEDGDPPGWHEVTVALDDTADPDPAQICDQHENLSRWELVAAILDARNAVVNLAPEVPAGPISSISEAAKKLGIQPREFGELVRAYASTFGFPVEKDKAGYKYSEELRRNVGMYIAENGLPAKNADGTYDFRLTKEDRVR